MVSTNLRINRNNIPIFNNRKLFEKYMAEIVRFQPMSREEEVELFKKIEIDKDQLAINKIIKHNLLFATSIAKRYSNIVAGSTLTLEDLVNEANLGLCVAINRFDYKKGFKFISYAVWWIQSYINESIKKNLKNIRLPNNIVSSFEKMKAIENRLEQELNRTPTNNEIFERMALESEMNFKTLLSFEHVINVSKYEKSIDQPITDDTTSELNQLLKSNDLSPDDLYIEKERQEIALKMLDILPNKIKDYFIDYFGLMDNPQLTIKEISIKYGVHISTVERSIKQNLRLLRIKNHNMKESLFPSSLETNKLNRLKNLHNYDKNVIYCI